MSELKTDEAVYRQRIQKVFDRIDSALADLDPDQVESEQALGALTIRLGDGSKCILSAQPSVRQLWLAVAARGTAYHFNYDAARGEWWDDKGKGVELVAFLKQYLHEAAGVGLEVWKAR